MEGSVRTRAPLIPSVAPADHVHSRSCLEASPKSALEGSQSLRLMRNLHWNLKFTKLPLPQNLHLRAYKMRPLPRSLHLRVHKVLHWPRNLHFSSENAAPATNSDPTRRSSKKSFIEAPTKQKCGPAPESLSVRSQALQLQPEAGSGTLHMELQRKNATPRILFARMEPPCVQRMHRSACATCE